jgi:TnpA family transposase
MKILNSEERETFEIPPVFNSVDRKKYFEFPLKIIRFIKGLKTPTNQVCFLVTFGYFKATKMFFSKKFHQKDIEFVARRFGIDPNQIKIESYEKPTYHRHKIIIREYFGFREFDEEAIKIVIKEINSIIRSQLRAKLILIRITEILMSRKIEIPSYTILANLIIDELKNHKQELILVIENQLTPKTREMLDALLEKEDNQSSKIQRYRLTLLKKFHQSTRPKKIKSNVEDLRTLKGLFQSIEALLKALNLTHEGIKYYAHSVIKSEIFQVSRKADEDRYLHLIAFVTHQYFKLQDLLIDTFLIAVQNNINISTREHKEIYYERRKEKNESIKRVVDYLDKNAAIISTIKEIVNEPNLSDAEKIERVQTALLKYEQQDAEIKEKISLFKEESETVLKDADFYCIVETKSIKLQNRVSDIVKDIEFDSDTSSKTLMAAIEYYKKKDGIIDKKAPTDFLEDNEQDIIFDSEGKFRVSLYKSLLFVKIADTLKAGTMNLKHSYKYRSLDEYLISKAIWNKNKNEYIQRAELTNFHDLETVLETLKHALDKQYNLTNENIINKKNEFITFPKNGVFQLSTPKVETEEAEVISEFFPKTYISLLEIMSTINKACNFLDVFNHWQTKYNKPKPMDKTFLAGIIGYGCHIGTTKIAKISKEINEHELENTINWYFSEENISNANDKILKVMDALDLPNIYRRDKYSLHTSSDGQKIDIAVDSLNAGYSFKYHGMNKGVNAYRFIDERNFLFHSNVFSSSEKEAAYVIDGLLHNDVVKSDIHSTDTDGYSEVIFAVAYFLVFYFAPRIKGLKRQTLYAFKKRIIYEHKNHKILPDKYINTKLIEENWDDILRFIATIKLKETTASQLFKRLNSYSKQHRLYRALKEFGRIVKSIFILNYIDDVQLRQAIEKQLNKIENAHKFSDAISFGNNQEFIYATKEEQEIAEGCRRLIENSIICWNYLYLSQKISGEDNFERKKEVINAIKNGSVVTWRHINLHGEYDFSEEKLQDSIGLNVPKILGLKIA